MMIKEKNAYLSVRFIILFKNLNGIMVTNLSQ